MASGGVGGDPDAAAGRCGAHTRLCGDHGQPPQRQVQHDGGPQLGRVGEETVTVFPSGLTRTEAGPSAVSSWAVPAAQKFAASSPSAPRRTACTAVESATRVTGGADDHCFVRSADAAGACSQK